MKKIIILSLILFGINMSASAQLGIISTYAGTGTAGHTGDGGLATAAQIDFPHGMLRSPVTGLIYFTEAGTGNNHYIRTIDPSTGIINTIAGTGTAGYGGDNGPATAATLNHPFDMVLDASGNLYFCDEKNDRVRKIDATTGVITTIAGNGINGYGADNVAATSVPMNDPSGIAIDASGNLFISERHRIRMIDASGIITTIGGNGLPNYYGDGNPVMYASFSFNNFLSFDNNGNLLVSDNGNHCVRKIIASSTTGLIDPSCTIMLLAGTPTVAGYSGDGGLATSAKLRYPGGILVNSSNDIFIADNDNNTIRRIDHATGIIKTVAGTGVPAFSGDGGPAINAKMNTPRDIIWDGVGNYYISDALNNRIRAVDGSPVLSVCPGSCITLTASAGVAYSWSPATGLSSSTEQNPTACPAVPTVYTVTVTDASGGTHTSMVAVSIATPPNVNANAIPVCTVPGTLTATSTYGGALTYQWMPTTGLGCPACASTSVATVTGVSSRIYTVTATDPATGCTNSDTALVSFNPSIAVSVDQLSPFAIQGDLSFTNCGSPGIQVQAFPAGGTYVWTGPAGGAISASTSQTTYLNPTVTATYTVAVTNSIGCSGKAIINVQVPTSCSPCDAFKASSTCTSALPDAGVLQPFHTVTSSTFTAFPSASIDNYYFANSITIPNNLTIGDKVFFMNPTKSITIGAGAHVHISHSHLFTCPSSTWSGISVTNTSTAYGVLNVDNNSLIEYAATSISCSSGTSSSRTAIWVDPAIDSAIVSSNGNIFNNNTNGMSFAYWPGALPATFAPDTTFPFIVSGNIFTGRLFDCFTDGVTSYPFVWPTVEYLQTPLSSPEYYNPRYNVDLFDSTTVIMTGSTANTAYAKNGIILNGNATFTYGASNSYYGFRIGIKDAAGNRAQNMFDHMGTNGILANVGASIELQNNLFRYIATYATGAISCQAPVNSQRYRILMNNGAGTGIGNKFYNCYNRGGIATVNLSNCYNYDISHVMMSLGVGTPLPSDGTLKSAINSTTSAYEMGNFHDNVFYNYHSALVFVVSTSATIAGSFFAEHNIFSASYWDGTGTAPDAFTLFPSTPRPILTTAIFFNGNKTRTATFPASPGAVHIDNNQINQVQTGIYATQTGDMHVFVENNDINIHSYSGPIIGSSSYGIKVNEGTADTITGNDIGGEGYTATNLNGIYVTNIGSSTTLSDISCNNVHDLTTGFNFQATTPPNYLIWQNNVMQKCKTGMNLAAIIGQQGSATAPIDNYWKDDGTFSSSGLYWWTSTPGVKQITANSSYTSGSVLYVRNISPSNMPSSGAYTGYVSGSTINPFTWSPSTYPYNSCTDQASAPCYGCKGMAGNNGNITGNTTVNTYDVFPNPNTGNITISQKDVVDGTVAVRVMNAVGASVYEGTLDFMGGQSQLILPDVASGVYIVELKDRNNHRFTTKMIVAK